MFHERLAHEDCLGAAGFQIKFMKLKIVTVLCACFCCMTAELRPKAAEDNQPVFASVAQRVPTLFTGVLIASSDFRTMVCSQSELNDLYKIQSCVVDWGSGEPTRRVVKVGTIRK
jgi:hypothetical protein